MNLLVAAGVYSIARKVGAMFKELGHRQPHSLTLDVALARIIRPPQECGHEKKQFSTQRRDQDHCRRERYSGKESNLVMTTRHDHVHDRRVIPALSTRVLFCGVSLVEHSSNPLGSRVACMLPPSKVVCT